MDVTVDSLFARIGRLTVEAELLRAQVAELTAANADLTAANHNLTAALAAKEPPGG